MIIMEMVAVATPHDNKLTLYTYGAIIHYSKLESNLATVTPTTE